MLTRKKYLKNPQKYFHKYYVEIAKEIGIEPSRKTINRVRGALMKNDLNLMTIPLVEWDAWAFSILAYDGRNAEIAFGKRGDYPTEGRLINMLKEICIEYAKGGNLNGKNIHR